MVKENKFLIRNGEREDFSLFGAFPSNSLIDLRLKADADRALLVIHSDGLADEKGEKYASFELEKADGAFSLLLDTNKLLTLSDKGLFYYHYELTKDGMSLKYAGEAPEVLEKDGWERQLLIYDKSFRTPDFMKGAMIYHIFVDRFKRSGKCAVRGVFNPDWDGGKVAFPPYPGADFASDEFFGGDLWGIAEKLDYIKSLGANVIYLSPVFSSPSNHKYDTADYMTVDEAFGGDEALENLICEAEKRDMHVILDGVFNHTGADSIYFDKYLKYGSGAYSSDTSPYANWYSFGQTKDKYECWWNVKILPKVNCDAESYRDFIFGKGGVVRKYIKMGISGFRLDVADELSDSFLETIRETVREENTDALVLGEVWEDASNKIAYSKRRHYFSGHQLDSVMNYPLREGIIAFIRDGDGETLRFAAETVYRHYPKCVSDCLMNFLGTHDTERILTVLAGESADGRTNDELSKMKMSADNRQRGLSMLRCAFAICALCYGVPSVFYGDEAGLEGYRDPFCRAPFPWGREDKETVSFFSSLGKLRRDEPLFKDGLFKVVSANENSFVFERFDGNEKIVVAVSRERELIYHLGGEFLCVYGSEKGSATNTAVLGEWSVGVYKK